MNQTYSNDDKTPAQHIDNYIVELADWQGEMLARLRRLVHEAAPEITEEWKWDTPIWYQKGNVLAFGTFKDHVKLNFFKGAFLEDPDGLFNASLEAKATRAIDFNPGDPIDEPLLRDLIRAAVAHNTGGVKKK